MCVTSSQINRPKQSKLDKPTRNNKHKVKNEKEKKYKQKVETGTLAKSFL